MATWLRVIRLATDGEGGGIDQNGPRETGVYLVESSDIATPLEAVEASTGTDSVPSYGEAHPTNPNLRATKITPRRMKDNPYQWIITVDWEIPTYNLDANGTGSGVTAEKYDIDFSVTGEERTEEQDHDAMGNAIASSARETLAGWQRTFYDETITITFKTTNLDEEGISTFRNTLNYETVTMYMEKGTGSNKVIFSRTFPPYTLKLGNMQYSLQANQDGTYVWNVTLPLHYRSKTLPKAIIAAAWQDFVEELAGSDTNVQLGWLDTAIDQGKYKLDSTGKRVKIYEDSDEAVDKLKPVSKPVWLNGAGGVLEIDSGSNGTQAKMLIFYPCLVAYFTGSDGLLNGLTI